MLVPTFLLCYSPSSLVAAAVGSKAMLVPDDADDWTEEQWMAWIKEANEADAKEPGPEDVWRPPRRSTGGGALGAAMLGLENALFGPREDLVVVEAPAKDDEPEPVTLYLDREAPERSWARINDQPRDNKD